jgi:hypothetical protein
VTDVISHCRHFAVTDSELIVDGTLLAGVTGDIIYAVPQSAMTGSITAQGRDVTNGEQQFYGNAGLTWILTESGNVGEVNARSAAELKSGAVYNATGIFDYGNNAYSMDVQETVSDFVADAVGTYGGNQYNWYVPMTTRVLRFSSLSKQKLCSITVQAFCSY